MLETPWEEGIENRGGAAGTGCRPHRWQYRGGTEAGWQPENPGFTSSNSAWVAAVGGLILNMSAGLRQAPRTTTGARLRDDTAKERGGGRPRTL